MSSVVSLNFLAVTVAIKLRLKNRPWGGGDKTPVFDSAAGGFVDVDGGTHLKEHRSATLREKVEQWRVESRAGKVDSSTSIAGR